jgi:carbonic anhydrase
MSLKTKTMKSSTVMEFFNDMFMGKADTQNTTSPNSTGNNQIVADWLEISSPSFKNYVKFPPITMPDGDTVPIEVDDNYFRINDAFDKNQKNSTNTKKDFWFRLSGTHIYYTVTDTDLNVLGAIAVSNIHKLDDKNELCFLIDDAEDNKWTLCSIKTEITKKWVCAIKKNLGLKNLPIECTYATAKANVTTIEKTVIDEKTIQPIILIPLPSKKCNEGWNYLNQGKDWECICSEGFEQSPIDLPSESSVVTSPVAPLFEYEEVLAKSPLTSLDGQVKSEEYIKIKYFANSLRIFHPNLGKIVTLDGTVYIAEEIVFHTPSEHTIEGKRFDMEMQIIHYGQSRGDIAKQAVLSFLFKKQAGIYNKFFDDVDFFDLPNPHFPQRDIQNNLYIPKVFYTSGDSDIPVMKPFSFYTYQGSITFPPCTERTIHYVASDAIPIASSLLELMKEALRIPDLKDEKENIQISAEEPENYRETRPLNGRPVFFYDHKKYCGPEVSSDRPVKQKGHYEKVPKKITQYYYVNGMAPSGLPGSYVVDEAEAKGQSK